MRIARESGIPITTVYVGAYTAGCRPDGHSPAAGLRFDPATTVMPPLRRPTSISTWGIGHPDAEATGKCPPHPSQSSAVRNGRCHSPDRSTSLIKAEYFYARSARCCDALFETVPRKSSHAPSTAPVVYNSTPVEDENGPSTGHC